MSTGTMEHTDALERMGRVAIATQGVLYAVTGFLAVGIARGDHGDEASKSGALEAVARQPFGRVLLVVILAGLLAHAAWRAVLAWRGEPGDDDAKSNVKRAGNAARTVLYLSLAGAAVALLTGSGGSSGEGNETERESTATVLGWPGGTVLVVLAGLAIIGAGLWNAKRAVTRSFEDKLDCSTIDESKRRTVVWMGTAGYLARAAVYCLAGWFLITAGLQHDPDEARGLDATLRELAATDHGPPLLLVVALGLVVFGAFRVLDAVLRRTTEVTWA